MVPKIPAMSSENLYMPNTSLMPMKQMLGRMKLLM